MLSKFTSLVQIPSDQLCLMSDAVSRSPTLFAYKPTSSIRSIRIWFVENTSTFTETLQTVDVLFRRPNSYGLLDPSIPPLPPPPPPISLLPPNRTRASLPLLYTFAHSFVFKLDKTNSNSRFEHSAYNQLPHLPTPFYVTACVRARSVSSPSSTDETISNSNNFINPNPAQRSTRASAGSARLLPQAASQLQPSPLPPPNKPSLSRPSSSASNEQPVTGLLMERCVGSLSDALATDSCFTSQMTVKDSALATTAFTWQPTQHIRELANRRREKSITRPPFHSLCTATCQRLLADLRSLPHLLHHLRHLALAVSFIHSYGVIHGDLKPHNVFIRVLEADNDHVTRLELLLADFDCAAVFPYTESASGRTVNWEKHISSSPGTYGYHPNLYTHSLSLNDAILPMLPKIVRPPLPPISQNKQGGMNVSEKQKQKKQQVRESNNHAGKNDAEIAQVGDDPMRKLIDAYRARFPYASPSDDVYGLGMVWLCMLERQQLSIPKALWIKSELGKCKQENSSIPAPLTQKNCSPAHVLLFHSPVSYTSQIPPDRLSSLSFYTVLESDKAQAARRTELIDKVKNGIIPNSLCQLLEAMTQEESKCRPSIEECLEELDKLINKYM